MRGMRAVSATLLLCSITGTAFASWVDIPLDDLIADADRVVVGGIESEGEAFGLKHPHASDADGKQWHVVGILNVRETLKGPKAMKIRLAYPKPPPAVPGLSIVFGAEDIPYKVGQEGIWILTRDRNGGDYYWATYPKDHQPSGQKAEILNALERLKRRRYGKPVNGLTLFAQPDSSTFAPGEPLRFKTGLRNLTSKEIRFGGPSSLGVMRLTLLDARRKTVASAERRDEPGTEEERRAGEGGRPYPSFLPPNHDTHDYTFLLSRMELPPQPPGKYRLRVTFTEEATGLPSRSEDLWRGTLRVEIPVVVGT